jgi:hypothetical protein
MHIHFLASVPKNPSFDALESVKSERERFVLKDGVFYLHVPDGIGRSKLAANVERVLGVSMTGRNWRTVCKIYGNGETVRLMPLSASKPRREARDAQSDRGSRQKAADMRVLLGSERQAP